MMAGGGLDVFAAGFRRPIEHGLVDERKCLALLTDGLPYLPATMSFETCAM